MPKRTAKYVKALVAANEVAIVSTDNKELLYQQLNQENYYWDASTKTWTRSQTEPNSLIGLVRVRVLAETAKVAEVAEDIRTVMVAGGYKLVEESLPYACRPPAQAESRIYLTFTMTD